MKYDTITKKNIRRMIDQFYSQVLKDELLSSFFIQKLGDEMISDKWLAHLKLLTDFWASVILEDTNYKGQPIKPHIQMKDLKRESFERWVKVFFESVDKYYTKESADIFKAHAKEISDNFMKLLKI